MKKILLAILFVLLVGSCFAQKPDSDVLATIERQGCLGSCPVYSARIYADATVIYHGVDFVKETGEKRYKIPEERIKKLIEAFEKINYFSLKDEYRVDENGQSFTCLPETITSFSLNGKTKRVANYLGAPQALDELEKRIEFLADLDFCIGPA